MRDLMTSTSHILTAPAGKPLSLARLRLAPGAHLPTAIALFRRESGHAGWIIIHPARQLRAA